MKRTMTGVAGLAAIAAVLVFAGSGPAAAQVAGARSAHLLDGHSSAVVQVRGRGRHGGYRGGYRGYRGWRGGYRGWRGGWGYYGPGAGFAVGVLLGSALAAPYYYDYPAYRYPRYRYYDPDVAYCLRRFKSYNPRTGTYLGYDGRRHPCP